ncbi:hypothetical protein JCM19235_6868 [Vibrio maritimus]|uniref:Uncharacterized protein n=1 Tax=Vibrio maritimus TaxID=990268 RepID=A0A090RSB8_9VIBR|nr:hypothetical protein JCM19235_6868 [Vibrio maritimus]
MGASTKFFSVLVPVITITSDRESLSLAAVVLIGKESEAAIAIKTGEY